MEASAIRHRTRRGAARPRARAVTLSGPELALAGLALAAVALRLWLMLGYGPAFLGFGDSHEYVTAAAHGVFADVQKPAGYPIFLAALHLISDGLAFTILVQHALGIAPGSMRARAHRAGVAAAAGLALVGAYPVAQGISTGYWGYQRQGAWNLYGRVATFVDCTHFSPPAGTRFLCPNEPPSRRAAESLFQYGAKAPAVRRFGGPSRAPAYANGVLERFSVAAIEHDPLAYAGAILDGLGYYISPRAGEGYTPGGIRTALLDRKGTASIQPAIAAYYPGSSGYSGGAGSLDAYERATRIQGPLLLAMLILALLGPLLLRERARWVAALSTTMALGPVILADAGNSYDARYGYPAFAALALAAALGAYALGSRAGPLRRAGGSGRAY